MTKLKICVFLLILVCVLCEEVKLPGEETSQHVDTVVSEHDKHGEHHLPHYPRDGEHWLHSFGWNVIGYSLILIPSFFLIRMIKTSNFYEQEGEGFLFRTIQCCVFGSNRVVSTNSNPFSFFRCLQGTSTSASTIRLLFCVLGLEISYLTWGVLQENIMTQKYGEGTQAVHFQNSEFLVFMNRIFALFVAAVYVFITGPNWNGPFYKFSFASLSNVCSSWCQYEALKFVSFPTQVLGKTSKMIPVMIMGKFVSRKTYQYYEYVVAVMISIGVSLFLLSTTSDKHGSAATTTSGLVLMIGYMMFDSFTSNWQSQLFSEYKVSSIQMMFNINTFSVLFTSVPLLLNGGMFASLQFMLQHSQFALHVFLISFASGTGQLFIFYTISEFGPLIFTTIMVTRQMFAILLSCLIYGHELSGQAVIGVAVVFVALFLQIYAKYRIKQKQHQQQQNMRQADMA